MRKQLALGIVAASTLARIVVADDELLSGPDPLPDVSFIESIRWMTGYWLLEESGRRVEELWLPAAGDLMLGLNRTLISGQRKAAAFEYLRIEQTVDGVFLIASPGGAPPTPFRLVEVTDSLAVFTNPDHDFPQRIEYRLDEEGRLVASIGGDRPGPSWTYERAATIE